MAKNDTLLIDGILDERVAQKNPSEKRDEAFEFFAFEQILRDADLSSEEIDFGWVDGGSDGGIDGFYTFVNGHLLRDPESFPWPKSGCELDLWIITCKHHETFKQAPLDNLVASLSELFDLAITPPAFKGSYSTNVIEARQNLVMAYRRVSPRLSRLSIHFAYASRGDSTKVGVEVNARAEQIVAITKDSFGDCAVKFEFWGSNELVTRHRQVRALTLELPFTEALTRGERYVLLCKLSDFFAFVTDESGALRRYLFESNVRAFMGLNRVNEDIHATLNQEDSPDFWWLNNGVTILANSANLIGKSIQMDRVQIVNGLQTTESIWRYFRNGKCDPHERSVLVKVIVSTDEAIRDSIIRATNNQTPVQLQSLHATDKVQRDIEEMMQSYGLFYERRTNFYTNQGHSPHTIITPIYAAAAFVSLVLKHPMRAANVKARMMRNEEFNEIVFSESTPLTVWPAICGITKNVDLFLESVRSSERGSSEHFLKRWRHWLSLLGVSITLNKFDFSVEELCTLGPNGVSTNSIIECWELIKGVKAATGRSDGQLLLQAAIDLLARDRAISGSEVLGKSPILTHKKRQNQEEMSPTFIDSIDAALPPQPWKVGVHKEVAQALGCSRKSVAKAIQILISQKRRSHQVNGFITSRPVPSKFEGTRKGQQLP